MNLTPLFFINSIMLGAGLAMDAFSVSVANGINEPKMKMRKMLLVAGTFSFFQFLMPMVGWVCVHTVVNYFSAFEKAVPYIALLLLLYIGIKMIIDSRKEKDTRHKAGVGAGALLLQGIATSIDALSVGFTIQSYPLFAAFISSLIIAAVTLAICYAGLIIGKNFGNRYSGKAEIIGGVILIAIGIEIFMKGIL